MKRTLLLTLSVLLLAVIMSASMVGLSNTVFANEVEIRVAWWGDTSRNNLYDAILDRFEAANPGIVTIREPSSWNDYWQKLTVQSASGAAPDFMGMHAQFANDYLRRGVVEPLDGFIEDGVIDVTHIPQGAIDTGVVDGVTYMIPMGLTGQSFIVNKTMLAELGLDMPDWEWTWDDLADLAIEGRAALDAAGRRNAWIVGDNSKNYQLFRYWVRQDGGELYTPEGGMGFNEEQLAAWWGYWRDLRVQGAVPDAATSIEYDNVTLENSLFVAKRQAITGTPANQFYLYVEAVPDSELVIHRNPTKAGGQVGEYVEGAHFAISSQTTPEKKLAAAKLIDFWVNTEESYELYGMDQGVPANIEMAEYIKDVVDERHLASLDYVTRISELASGAPPIVYPPAGGSEIDSLFRSTAEYVMYDVMSPEAAAKSFFTQAEAILARNR